MADLVSDANLYGMSRLILRSFPHCFVKLDPHDPEDPDHVDMLWFEYGEVNGHRYFHENRQSRLTFR